MAIGAGTQSWNRSHNGLQRLIENDGASGLQPAVVTKVRCIVSVLQDMESEDELRTVPSWKAHMLTGDHKGIWSFCNEELADDISNRPQRYRDHRPRL